MNRITVLAEITKLEKDAAEALRKADALRQYLGSPGPTKTQGKAAGSQRKASGKAVKRTRRTAEEVEAIGAKLRKLLASSKDGVSPAEMRKITGDSMGTMAAVLKRFGIKHKTSGPNNQLKYFPA